MRGGGLMRDYGYSRTLGARLARKELILNLIDGLIFGLLFLAIIIELSYVAYMLM